MIWQDYARTVEDTATVKNDGTAYISIDNNTSGVTYRIEQVTCSTKNNTAVLMSLSRGINNVPTLLICSTSDFTGAAVQGSLTTSSCTAVGPPFVYLNYGESLIASVFGGFTGDIFQVLCQYTIGTLY